MVLITKNGVILTSILLIVTLEEELCPQEFKWSTDKDCYFFSIEQKSWKDAREYCKTKDATVLGFAHHYLSTDIENFYASIDYTHTEEYLNEHENNRGTLEGYIWTSDLQEKNENDNKCYAYHTVLKNYTIFPDCKKLLYFLCKRSLKLYSLC